ncbi:hypothetical protein [Flavobacterium sp. B183]|uniref:hypothetical protein n=1 Tax=Flavobacterium sp. B183 TaxID=907046 RepID=UPI00201F2134|nr:hypothetical protein [Flavobacterium sp. B183]URC11436.1 hypothetical protein M4I44_15180 [Flavobacterium sp. B183]
MDAILQYLKNKFQNNFLRESQQTRISMIFFKRVIYQRLKLSFIEFASLAIILLNILDAILLYLKNKFQNNILGESQQTGLSMMLKF